MIENQDTVIFDIMQKYPEKEWLKRCHKALPGVDDFELAITFEILSGGDVRIVEDDGTEHGLFDPILAEWNYIINCGVITGGSCSTPETQAVFDEQQQGKLPLVS